MCEPESTKIDPWSSFPQGPTTSLFGDDFESQKLLGSRVVASGSRSTLNLEGSIEKRGDLLSFNDQLKFWFRLPKNGSVFTKLACRELMKVHYDHGIQDGGKWNFYGSFGSNKAINKINFKIGAQSISEHCRSDNRLKISSERGVKSYHYYHRTIVKHNKFTFGILGVLDIGGWIVQKNDFLINYQHNEDNFVEVLGRVGQDEYFRNQRIGFGDFRKYFQNIKFGYIRNLNKQFQLGIQATLACGENVGLEGLQLAAQFKTQDGNKQLKAKINENIDLNLSLSYKFNQLARFIAMGCLHKAHKQTRFYSYGFRLDLNV